MVEIAFVLPPSPYKSQKFPDGYIFSEIFLIFCLSVLYYHNLLVVSRLFGFDKLQFIGEFEFIQTI